MLSYYLININTVININIIDVLNPNRDTHRRLRRYKNHMVWEDVLHLCLSVFGRWQHPAVGSDIQQLG